MPALHLGASDASSHSQTRRDGEAEGPLPFALCLTCCGSSAPGAAARSSSRDRIMDCSASSSTCARRDAKDSRSPRGGHAETKRFRRPAFSRHAAAEAQTSAGRSAAPRGRGTARPAPGAQRPPGATDLEPGELLVQCRLHPQQRLLLLPQLLQAAQHPARRPRPAPRARRPSSPLPRIAAAAPT